MHFRHLIISGLMVGAALTLPHSTFAAKNETANEKIHLNSDVKMVVQGQVKKANDLEKTAHVNPEHGNKSQGGVHQNPMATTHSQKSGPKIAETKSLKKWYQTNGKVHSSINKNVHAIKSFKTRMAAVPASKWIQLSQKKTKSFQKELPENIFSHSFQKADSKAVTNHQNQDLHTKLKPLGEGFHSSLPIKKAPVQKLAKKKTFNREPKTPLNNKKVPEPSQMIDNPGQRVQNTGGHSTDRINTGNNFSFIEKWFVWSHHLDLKLGESYVSRRARFRNQWVNAPPSPPPEKAPFHLPSTVA